MANFSSDIDLRALFTQFAQADHIALAVSGGGDSVGLMVLAAAWRKSRPGPRVSVLTVDHGLRREAAREARQVAAWARDCGFDHVVLEWTGEKPVRVSQARAREARYGLMLDWCGAHDVTHLGLAHTLDDQAETVMMRLARGSGVDGLAAMAPASMRAGVALVRPLLALSRAWIRDFLRAWPHAWIEDPGNEDTYFERVRMRRMLADVGFDPEKLALTARRMARARQALDDMADQAARGCVIAHEAGFCTLDAGPLSTLSAETALRIVKACLMSVGGSIMPPSLEKIEKLVDRILAAGFKGATLSGCAIWAKSGHIIVAREAGRKGLPELDLEPGRRLIWDRRFNVALKRTQRAPMSVRALGADGWRELKAALGARPCLPASIGRSCAAFFRDGELKAVPHMDYYAEPGISDGIEARFIVAGVPGFGARQAAVHGDLNRIFTKKP